MRLLLGRIRHHGNHRWKPLLWIGLSPALLYMATGAFAADPARRITVAAFSSAPLTEGLPDGWRHRTFPGRERHTRYDRVLNHSQPALRAVSKASSSMLVRKIQVDPERFPWICWRWKVTDPIRGENVRVKEGDDYAARVYITFEVDPAKLSPLEKLKRGVASALFGEDLPYRAINYIWSLHEPEDTMVPNPYTESAMMIVATNGTGRLGSWISVRRNIVDDYRRAFGEKPPGITGFAVMTDSDDTGDAATAYYGDIFLSSEPPSLPSP